MSLDSFKRTLWFNRYIVNVDKAMVFKNVADTNWNVVGAKAMKINEIGDISVSNYSDTAGVTFENVPDAGKTLDIDQFKSFAFKVNDVDKAQMDANVMDGAMRKAAHAMANTQDQFIAGLYGDAGITSATNLGSSTTGLNLKPNMMPDLITYMERYLKENNAYGRPWCVAPPWFMQLLRHAMITNTANTFDTPNSTALTGAVPGMGFDFYESNNVSNDGTDYRIMFGTSDAIGFADQLKEIEAVRLESYFSDGVKGLSIYGGKVIRPEHLGVVYAQFTSLST